MRVVETQGVLRGTGWYTCGRDFDAHEFVHFVEWA
jgi:hypothetical protein